MSGFTSAGHCHNFVKITEAGKYKLDDVIKLMHQPSGDFAKYFVHMFHGIVDVDSFESEKKEILNSKRVFDKLVLRSTAVPGFFINDKNGGDIQKSHNLKVMLKKSDINVGLSMRNSDETMDHVFTKIARKEVTPYYAMNFDDPSLHRYLHKVPHHIAERVNSDLGNCTGINQPTFYLSSAYSFSDMHVEDGYLDSCNIMRWAEDGAVKYWLLVNPRFNVELLNLISNTIENLRVTEDCSAWLPNCATPLNHKNIVLTPSFLRENGIPYMTVIQPAGSLIYVRDSVYHQVFSTGVTFAEAVNVGGGFWNTHSHSFVSCHCPGVKIVSIPGNFNSYSVVKSRKDHILSCSIEGCLDTTRSINDLKHHESKHKDHTFVNYYCSLCLRLCASEASLRLHHRNVHGMLECNDVICGGCKKIVRASNFLRHLKSCGSQKRVCARCRREFSARGIVTHEKHCTAPIGLFDI